MAWNGVNHTKLICQSDQINLSMIELQNADHNCSTRVMKGGACLLLKINQCPLIVGPKVAKNVISRVMCQLSSVRQ